MFSTASKLGAMVALCSTTAAAPVGRGVEVRPAPVGRGVEVRHQTGGPDYRRRVARAAIGACAGDRDAFNPYPHWGTVCSSYAEGEINRAWCGLDRGSDGLLANQVCSECDLCTDEPVWSPATLTPPWNDDPSTITNWNQWCEFEALENCYACRNDEGAAKFCTGMCVDDMQCAVTATYTLDTRGFGSGSCPTGYEHITDPAVCKIAGAEVSPGIGNQGIVHPEHPVHGCFRDTLHNRIYMPPATTNGGGHGGHMAPICQRVVEPAFYEQGFDPKSDCPVITRHFCGCDGNIDGCTSIGCPWDLAKGIADGSTICTDTEPLGFLGWGAWGCCAPGYSGELCTNGPALDKDHCIEMPIRPQESGSGWSSSKNHRIRAAEATPDGDGYYVSNEVGESMSKVMVTTEYTISSAMRGAAGLRFEATWASSWNGGVRFIAQVDGIWYGSAPFGEGAASHGAMTGTAPTSWEKTTVHLDASDLWYASADGAAPTTYAWRDGARWSSEPVVATGGLPKGKEVTAFGFAWKQSNNGHTGALDSFNVYSSGV